MAEFIYLPVPTDEMTQMAEDIRSARRRAGLAEPAILRNFFDEGIGKGFLRAVGRGCLRGVGGNDRLFLLLHGRGEAGSQRVGANRNHGIEDAAVRFKTYTPNAIATLLEAEGLTRAFVDLVLLCCGAGLEGGHDPAFVKSIAERVYDAMRPRFPNINVTGYLGNVKAGAGNDYRVDRAMEGYRGNVREIVDASEAVVRFPRQ